MPKLSTRKVQTAKKPGMLGDGDGLYLRVGPKGGKSWVLRTVVHGRRRDLGIGSASLVSLAEAREIARQLRKVARAGADPDTLRRRETLTFEEAARRVHNNLLPTWRSERHGQIWLAALERYVFPHFGKRPISTIGTVDLLNALTPIWVSKNDTARSGKAKASHDLRLGKGCWALPARKSGERAEESPPSRPGSSQAHGGYVVAGGSHIYGRTCGARRHLRACLSIHHTDGNSFRGGAWRAMGRS